MSHFGIPATRPISGPCSPLPEEKAFAGHIFGLKAIFCKYQAASCASRWFCRVRAPRRLMFRNPHRSLIYADPVNDIWEEIAIGSCTPRYHQTGRSSGCVRRDVGLAIRRDRKDDPRTFEADENNTKKLTLTTFFVSTTRSDIAKPQIVLMMPEPCSITNCTTGFMAASKYT